MQQLVSTIERMSSRPAPESTRQLIPALLHPTASDTRVQADMGLLRTRKAQLMEVRGSKTIKLRKHKMVLVLNKFLKSTARAHYSWIVATDDDVVDCLFYLDSQGEGTTVLQKPACSEFGSKYWGSSIKTLGRARRYPVASLERGFVTKLWGQVLLRIGRACK